MSVWSDAPWGFGGNGGGRDDCVYSGPFRKGQWQLPDGGCLKRKFNGKINNSTHIPQLSQPLFGSNYCFLIELYRLENRLLICLRLALELKDDCLFTDVLFLLARLWARVLAKKRRLARYASPTLLFLRLRRCWEEFSCELNKTYKLQRYRFYKGSIVWSKQEKVVRFWEKKSVCVHG